MRAWLIENWFNLFSAIGVIGSLLFAGASLRSETEIRRIGNLLTLTNNHRELWSELFRNPELKRVLDVSPDLPKNPVTREERFFVNMVIQHVSSAFEAIKTGLTTKPQGLSQDVAEFFSLPIPRKVWDELKSLQNDNFMNFVDACLDERTKINQSPSKIAA